MSRKLLVIFTVLMVVAMLTACARATPQPSAAPEPTKAPEPTQAPEPAALPPVELTWILDGGGTPRDAEEVFAYLNNLPQVKALNVTVKPIWYDWGSFNEKTKLMFAAGEPCDLIFTANWANDYFSGALSGNFLALDDLLPKYAPNTLKQVSKAAWDTARVNGKLYALVTVRLWYGAWGYAIRKDLADKYGVSTETINSYEDLTPLAAKILADYPDLKNRIIAGGAAVYPATMGYDVVRGVPGGWAYVKRGDASRTVIPTVAMPEYRERLALQHEWYKAGYLPLDPIGSTMDADALRKEGYFPIKLHTHPPGDTVDMEVAYGQGPWIAEPLMDPVLDDTTSSMTAICASSKNPERALMFYELMSTDAEVWRTFARGLEGKHWVWVDKDKNIAGFPAGVDSTNSGYNPNTDWMYSNTFLAPYKSAAQVGSHEETERGNARAALPMPGPFIFDPTPVSAEMAALDTVYKQYMDPLYYGLVDPADPKAGLDALAQAMKDAGLDKVVAEIQKQLDAFVAANPDIFK